MTVEQWLEESGCCAPRHFRRSLPSSERRKHFSCFRAFGFEPFSSAHATNCASLTYSWCCLRISSSLLGGYR